MTEVISLERDPENFSIAAKNLAMLAREHNLSLLEGDGLQWLARHPGRQFDLVIIDIDKTEIAGSFEVIAQAVAPGGLLIVDNALMKNRVMNPQTPWERQTDMFNQLLSRDARFLSVLLPVRDGLNMLYRVYDHGR